MFAWVLGVIRTLNVVVLVVTGRLIPVTDTTSDAGLVTDPYTVDPPLFVISTRLSPAEVPAASVTVAAVTVSVPLLVTSVKASTLVAAPSGARVVFPGLVPSPIVVTPRTYGCSESSAPILAALFERVAVRVPVVVVSVLMP